MKNKKETLQFIQQCRNLILDETTSEDTLSNLKVQLHYYIQNNDNRTNQLYDLLGRLYLRENDFVKAREYLTKAQIIYPYSAGTIYQLFKIDVIEGKHQNAYSHLKRHVQVLEQKNLNNHFETTFALLSLIHKIKVKHEKWEAIPIRIKYRKKTNNQVFQILWNTYCDFIEEKDLESAYIILVNINEYVKQNKLPLDILSEILLVVQLKTLVYQQKQENNRKLYQYCGNQQSLQELISNFSPDTIEYVRSCNYLIENGFIKNSEILDKIPSEFFKNFLKRKQDALSYIYDKDNELAITHSNYIERLFVKRIPFEQILNEVKFAYQQTGLPHLLWYLLKLSYLTNDTHQFQQYKQKIEQSEIASNFVSLHALEYLYYCYQLETNEKKEKKLRREINKICSLEENKGNREIPKQYMIKSEVHYEN